MDKKLFSRSIGYLGVCILFMLSFGARAQTYCTPYIASAYAACNNYNIKIIHLDVAGVSGTSINDDLACDGTGFTDRTSLSASLMSGNSATLNITVGNDYSMYTHIWIDFNDDGTYESVETVGVFNYHWGEQSIMLTIPSGAATGNHRMRVLTNFYTPGDGTAEAMTACGSYSYGECRDYTVNIVSSATEPNAGTISGTTSLCVGTASAFAATVAGGTWSSSNTAVAVVDVTGTVTGVASGTAVIFYTVAGAASAATQSVTVNAAPFTAGTISAPSYLCLYTAAVLSPSIPGGTWSSTGGISIDESGNAGYFSGSYPGTSIITYTITNECGSGITTFPIEQLQQPYVGSVSGTATGCAYSGYSTIFASGDEGGVWSSSNEWVTDVSWYSGNSISVYPNSDGMTDISYTVSNSCGTASASMLYTVYPQPYVYTYYPYIELCPGSSQYADGEAWGGISHWTSSNPYVAAVDYNSGLVTAQNPGYTSVIVSVESEHGCGTATAWLDVSVDPLADAGTITGDNTVAVGSSVALYETSWYGNWMSSNSSIAQVDYTGNVTGIAAGNVVISFITWGMCGEATASLEFTVTPVVVTDGGIISGPSAMCMGTAASFTSSVPGGTWSSSNIGVVAFSGGDATAVSAGTATVSYIVADVAPVVTTVMVVDGSIAATAVSVCSGQSTTLFAIASHGNLGTGAYYNGHSYYMVTNAEPITWTDAKNAANAAGGHLVTITDAGEQAFFGLINTLDSWTGLFQNHSSPSYSEPDGGWEWVTGEPFAYSNWYGIEPNNSDEGAAEDFGLAFMGGLWNDNTNFAPFSSYVVEFDYDDRSTHIWSTGATASSISVTPTMSTTYTCTTTLGGISCPGSVSVTVGNAPVTINAGSTVCIGMADTFTAASCRTTSLNTSGNNDRASGSIYSATDNITMESWINWDGSSVGIPSLANMQVIMSNGNSAHNGYSLVLDPFTGKLRGAVNGQLYLENDSMTVTPNTWNHVAVVRNSGTWSVYLNGAQYVTTNNALEPTAPAENFTIGGSNIATSNSPFRGVINDSKFWTMPRSTAEINADMTDCNTAPQAHLAGYWKLNEGVGNLAADFSGSGHNLTIANPNWINTMTSASYAWSFGDGATSTAASAMHTYSIAGTYTTAVSVTSASGCTATSTSSVTVNPMPSAGTINGAASTCMGSGATALSATVAGGTWASSNASIASVNASGIVSPVAVGSAIISYTVTSVCGSAYATHAITVVPALVVTAISGLSAICGGSATNFSNTTVGGVWSARNTRATVSVSGVVTAVGIGVDTIRYSVSSICGVVVTVAKTITVTAPLAAVVGTSSICDGSTAVFSTSASGGVWSVSNSTVAGLGTGSPVTVSGLSAGMSVVTYSSGSCYSTRTLTVNPMPSAITGLASACVGVSVSLSNTVPGGVWSSSAPASVTVSVSGVARGVFPYTATIKYTIGSCWSSVAFTANANPAAITGTGSVCEGATATLASVTAGGTWSVANPLLATISGSSPLSVSGLSAGTSTVTYTFPTGCSVSRAFTVNATPSAIGGSLIGCTGTPTTLTNTVPGGTWGFTTPSIVSIAPDGGVTTIGAGSTVVRYTVGSCQSTATFTVNPAPAAITGTSTVCVGSTATLNTVTPGGIWSVAGGSVAAISGLSPLVVTGLSAGTTSVAYTLPTGCSAMRTVAVNAAPSAISGPASACAGTVTNLSNMVSGGVWSSSAAAVATVAADGMISAVRVGTTTIKYTIGGCSSSVVFTVNALPAAITGTNVLCEGASATFANATTGGTWSVSGNASIDIATHVVTGVAAGAATVSYTSSVGCVATRAVTVNIAPSAISGPSAACVGVSTSLTNTVAGGVWTSAFPTSVTVSSAGVVRGVYPYTSTIRYTIGTCSSSLVFTSNANPAAITGTGSVCAGSATTLATTSTGGAWSVSTPSIATISGISPLTVSGLSAGSATVFYMFPTGCTATRAFAVNALPSAIGGSMSTCLGTPVQLTNTLSGGTWGFVTPGIVQIAADGTVSTVAAGSLMVKYTVGSCQSTATFTVNPSPKAITGVGTVCAGSVVTLSDVSAGGTWSTATGSIATVLSSTGASAGVRGLSAGIATITYSIGSCGVTKSVTVNNCGARGVEEEGTAVVAHEAISVTIFPNPATSRISVKSSVTVNVKLYTADGRQVMDEQDAHDLDVSSLSAGVYMIMVYDTNNQLIKTERHVKME